MKNTSAEKKWYDNTWLVIILCIVFFPVGVYALWKNQSISKGWKIGVTVLIAIILIVNFSDFDNKGEFTSDNSSGKKDSTPMLTQEQKDSIALLERQQMIEEREARTISASSLVRAYENNEVRADENYKNEKFYVEGSIDDIGKDILGDIYVTLKAGNSFRTVQCYIKDKNVVKDLQKGQKITIYGKCSGLMINVHMKDSKVVENLSELKKR